MKKIPYNPALLEKAKELRKNMTPEERHLWYIFLKNYPLAIYRQRPIGNYIVDFYCPEAKLIIEIDGSQHGEDKAAKYDQRRTDFFNEYQLKVIRFTNKEVNSKFHQVCEQIHFIIEQQCNKKIYWD